ncbi:unnamed protein product, partial [Medioppia subpectinata]
MIGRNFGVITCEPCKAFFRRNGLKDQPMYCPSNGKCIINPLTRQICKKCRLNKCFAMGMKKELIRNNEQNKRKKQLIIENKFKQMQINANPKLNPQNNLLINENNVEFDLKCNPFENLIYNNSDKQIMQTVINDTDLNNTTNNHIQCYKQNLSQELSIIYISNELTDYNGLKQLEINRISELMMASDVLNYPLISNGLTYKMENLEELIKKFSYMNEKLITDIISFTKGLMGFNNMCADDRLALVKYNTKDIISICTLRHYDRETECFVTPIGNEYSLQKFLSEWDYKDPIIINLLRAIILFNPNQPNTMANFNCLEMKTNSGCY